MCFNPSSTQHGLQLSHGALQQDESPVSRLRYLLIRREPTNEPERTKIDDALEGMRSEQERNAAEEQAPTNS